MNAHRSVAKVDDGGAETIVAADVKPRGIDLGGPRDRQFTASITTFAVWLVDHFGDPYLALAVIGPGRSYQHSMTVRVRQRAPKAGGYAACLGARRVR